MSVHIQRRQTEYILVQGTKKEKSSVKVADVTRHYENILPCARQSVGIPPAHLVDVNRCTKMYFEEM